jgi:NAD+ synthase (glutamine-hydrolysing)
METPRSLGTPLTVPVNKCILATCNLNQWALDFDGNLERIIASIRKAKELGAKYRLGPELEVSGYSCEDHFMELDTMMHCDQSLAAILEGDLTDGILCDIGCPILHKNVRYNCRVFCLNRKIVLIRPKISLADDGNYREKRFFASWDYRDKALHDHLLSDLLRKITGQTVVPMGVGIVATEETTIASEICEELWTAKSPHINYFLSGVEIISNGSGSHHSLRKLDSRLTLMKEPTRKCGGVYLYSNSRGCDGNRVYFDGSSLICVNGEVVAQATQFSLNEVEVITAVVDLDAVRSYRQETASFQEQSSYEAQLPVVNIRHFSLRHTKSASYDTLLGANASPPIKVRMHTPEEECAMGPACWLWDYLRRSGASGYLLPLSGGADSAAVAAIVRVMCMMAADAALSGNEAVIADIRKLFKNNNASSEVMDEIYSRTAPVRELTPSRVEMLTSDSPTQLTPVSNTTHDEGSERGDGGDVTEKRTILANELNYQILHTVYLGTSNSSTNTLDRAKRLAGSIRAYHNSLVIDDIVLAVLRVFVAFSGRTPRYVSQGGSMAEDLALQNIQARLRMVMSYMCAQLFPWLRGNKGFLLVLSCGNVDEALRGYMTKYDCSSGDVNPIGGICKGDLKRMLAFLSGAYGLPVLDEIAKAVPSAELRPFESTRCVLAETLSTFKWLYFSVVFCCNIWILCTVPTPRKRTRRRWA